MSAVNDGALPFAGLHVTDGGSLAERRVLVLVDGRPVAELPATSVRYEVAAANEPGTLFVGVHAERAAVTGGAREAVGRI
jgi:hypothetical protein